MAWIVLLVILGIVFFVAYRKVPAVNQFFKSLLGPGGGGGDVSQKQLDALDKVLEAEKARTKVLEEKAALAVQARDKRGRIAQERQKQQQERQKIIGGK